MKKVCIGCDSEQGSPHERWCLDQRPRWTVAVQVEVRKGHPVRYGYVIREPGQPDYMSSCRWSSAEAAQKAGEADACQGPRR